MMAGEDMRGISIILMKGYNGKSRLNLDPVHQTRLINALATDLYNTAVEHSNCNGSWDSVIATPNQKLSDYCKKNNIKVLDLELGELNSIFNQIQNWVVGGHYDAFILFAGDIPLLQKTLITKIEDTLCKELKKNGKSLVICPSKRKGVSVIGMTPPNLVPIREQKGIANFHLVKKELRSEFQYNIIADIGSYLDIDRYEDLCEVLMLMEKNPSYDKRAVKIILREILTISVNKHENDKMPWRVWQRIQPKFHTKLGKVISSLIFIKGVIMFSMIFAFIWSLDVFKSRSSKNR